MVMQYADGLFAQKAYRPQNFIAQVRVFFNFFILFKIELGRLQKNFVTDADFSDVMQKRAELNRLRVFR